MQQKANQAAAADRGSQATADFVCEKQRQPFSFEFGLWRVKKDNEGFLRKNLTLLNKTRSSGMGQRKFLPSNIF
nr:hypothetical protein CFP56_68916 [Quercus suber]